MSEPTNPFTSSTGKRMTCMEMLQLILDGEVTHEQREYFRSHMDQCLPCFQTYQVDMAMLKQQVIMEVLYMHLQKPRKKVTIRFYGWTLLNTSMYRNAVL